MKPIRNILLATDFSSASRPAFRRAVALAVDSRATLWIGNVIPPAPRPTGGSSVPRMYREMDLFLREDAEKRLKALVTAARVLATAPCPVMTVRPR